MLNTLEKQQADGQRYQQAVVAPHCPSCHMVSFSSMIFHHFDSVQIAYYYVVNVRRLLDHHVNATTGWLGGWVK